MKYVGLEVKQYDETGEVAETKIEETLKLQEQNSVVEDYQPDEMLTISQEIINLPVPVVNEFNYDNYLKTKQIMQKKTNKFFIFQIAVSVFLLFFCVLTSSATQGILLKSKEYLKNNISYNGYDSSLISKSELFAAFAGLFNEPVEANAEMFNSLDIIYPFMPTAIVEQNGGLLFKNNKVVTIKSSMDGVIDKITKQNSLVNVEIKGVYGIIVKYSNLFNVGIKEKNGVKAGDIFATANTDVLVEVFYGNKKINLGVDENGKIKWQI